jgi:hypothetical protein
MDSSFEFLTSSERPSVIVYVGTLFQMGGIRKKGVSIFDDCALCDCVVDGSCNGCILLLVRWYWPSTRTERLLDRTSLREYWLLEQVSWLLVLLLFVVVSALLL